jgi:predicted nucleic acid-binding protein
LLVDGASQGERLAAVAKIDRGQSPFVTDLVTIAELTRRDVFTAAKQVMGRVLVPRSAEDELMDALQLADRQGPAATLGECDGRVVLAEVSAEGHAQRQIFMRQVLTNLKACEVVPVLGPAQPSNQLRQLTRVLDATTADAIYLALERGAILLTEDGAIQRFYTGVSGASACSIQPILLVAEARKRLTHKKVAEVLAQKIADNHDFVTVRAQDLLVLARKTPHEVSELVRIALRAIGKPTVEFSSAINVALEFVARIARELPTHIVGAYVKLTFDALIEDRDSRCNELRQLFTDVLQPKFGRHGRRLTALQRQHFGRVFERR